MHISTEGGRLPKTATNQPKIIKKKKSKKEIDLKRKNKTQSATRKMINERKKKKIEEKSCKNKPIITDAPNTHSK